MINNVYKKQVALLLDILPEIAREQAFALHGGTAINLFHSDMPRLSVDIDLTFVPYSENREADLKAIRVALERLKIGLGRQISHIRFDDQRRADEELKLICSTPEATVKVEVNQINRGLIDEPCVKILCNKAQEVFDCFCEVTTVSFGQLWGGKLNAALDRQHPRDLFDCKHLLDNAGFTDDIRIGFIFFLLCGKRPFHEMLRPKSIDQQTVFDSQFAGMTDENFSYRDYEMTHERLIHVVNQSLSDDDKRLIYTFAEGNPDWQDVDYSSYPAIRWKLLNIRKLGKDNPAKLKEQLVLLEKALA